MCNCAKTYRSNCINYTCSFVVLFIKLDAFGGSLRCRNVCLLLNIMELNGTPLVMHEAPKIHPTNSAPTFLCRNNDLVAQKRRGCDQFYANNIFFYWATNANCITLQRRMLATAGQDVDFNSILL